jgi:Thaumarchaeal output domain 1
MPEKILTLENGIRVQLLDDCIDRNEIPDTENADIWIINNEKAWEVRKFLISVIRHPDPKVFLKPVFLQKDLKKIYKEFKNYNLKHLCDGYIQDLNIQNKIPYIQFILNFIAKLDASFHQGDLLKKTLLYYHSRNKDIDFYESANSLNGYSYPRIEAYYDGTTDAYINGRALLHDAYKDDLLHRKYVDTSHICKKCHSGFLNYREECPKCKEHNLQVRVLIHHFRCAHVATEQSFQQGDRLICPKCSMELRNLGVDYDKPGKVFYCLNEKCKNEFQKPLIGVHCINCKTEQAPAELHLEKIYNYELTQKAINEILN